MNSKIDFYDIYDYDYLPLYKTTFFKWTIFIFILFIVMVLTFFVIKFFIKKRIEKELSADFWALRALKKLNTEKLESKSDYKKFYFDLTFIIKKYLNKRYGWLTQDKTDDELLQFLKEKQFDSDLLQSLKAFISGALWVKFAGEDVLRIQAEKDLNLAYNMVSKTREEKKNN